MARILGSKNKRKTSADSEPKLTPLPTIRRYYCMHCGLEKSEREFYVNKWSHMWAATSRRAPICKKCLGNFYKRWEEEYGAECAAEIVCHYLDLGFNQKQFEGACDGGDFNVGEYVKAQNLTQQQFQTYADTISAERQSTSAYKKAQQGFEDGMSVRWSREDKQNKQYVISTIGYDPYAGTDLSAADLIFCYNVLAGYCDMDGVQADGHKIQCIIQITNSHLQCKKIDDQIFSIYSDPLQMANLSKVKKELLASISQISKDNNIASAYNKNSKAGKNTLSQKMKDMAEGGYWPAKQNFFDAKTSEAMRQIADLSHRSIMEQLALDENDYAQMVKEQREMIASQNRRMDELEEENRNLKNRLVDLVDERKKAGG